MFKEINLKEFNLEQVDQRLAELDEEVRNATEVEFVEQATVFKQELIERQAELKDLEERKAQALAISKGEVQAKTIEQREEIKLMEKQVYDIESPEYRTAFIKHLMGKELTEVEQRGAGLIGGGNALPQQTANLVIEKLHDMVPLLNEIELFRVDGKVSFMVETVTPTATLEATGGAVTQSDATLTQVTLNGYNINALIPIGADLAKMAVPAFESWLVRKLAEAIAYKIEYYLINGNGTNQPHGVENYAAWDVSDKTGVDWASTSLGVGDLDAAIGLVPAAYDNESIFVTSKKTFYKYVVNLTDVNNYPVVNRDDNTFYIRGFRVAFSDQIRDKDIFFGSFKRGIGANLSVDINVEKQRNLRYNTWDFLGWGVFDCKPAQAGCIVKISDDIPA